MTTEADKRIDELREYLLQVLEAIAHLGLVWREWAEDMDRRIADPPLSDVETMTRWSRIGRHVVLADDQLLKRICAAEKSARGIGKHLQYGMGSEAGPWETEAVKRLHRLLDDLQPHMPGEAIRIAGEGIMTGISPESIGPEQVREKETAFRDFADKLRTSRTIRSLMEDLDCVARKPWTMWRKWLATFCNWLTVLSRRKPDSDQFEGDDE